MKRLLMTSLALTTVFPIFLLFQMSGCKKTNDPVAVPYSIQGLWTGTYSVDGQPALGQQYFSLIIKPDGTMINDTKGANLQFLSTGSWTLTGDTLACTFTCVYGPANIGAVETTKAYFDKTNGKLTSGIWKNANPAYGAGTFALSRIN